MSRLLQRLTGGAASRPAATTGIVLALAIAGGILALGLRPSAGIDTFVSGTSQSYRATVAQQRLFGVNGVQILVSEPLTTLLSPSALERVTAAGGVPRRPVRHVRRDACRLPTRRVRRVTPPTAVRAARAAS